MRPDPRPATDREPALGGPDRGDLLPSYRVRSRELGELVRGEDGHARVVERIAALEGTHNYTRA
jgi:hypothetical protein